MAEGGKKENGRAGENEARRRAYLILMRGMRSLVRDEIDNYPALYALPLIRAISTRA